METLRARTALVDGQWAQRAEIDIGEDGRIAAIRTDCPTVPESESAIALPAVANLHSHSFQRAMAGLTERRGAEGTADFWSWRTLMYRFLQHLTADDVEAIAALAFVEMMEAGYASVGEFHYLHHQPDGGSYSDPAELGGRIVAAADETGIGLTHLPVLYMRGGLEDEPVSGGQVRFACDTDRFAELFSASARHMAALPEDCRIGIAPHSLRAVSRAGLGAALDLVEADTPFHIHIAEQTAEVAAVEAALGQRPVRWLLDRFPVDRRWCLIHATHMTPEETGRLARSGAVAGLCPITESNLGDGIFDGRRFIEAGGWFGIGSDSNVRVALTEELRTLEYSQRLGERRRAVLACPERSCGRLIYAMAARAGAAALGRASGTLTQGQWADIALLDGTSLALDGAEGDEILDRWIFCGDDRLVRDVYSAGRHQVRDGRHVARERVEDRYRSTLARLREQA